MTGLTLQFIYSSVRAGSSFDYLFLIICCCFLWGVFFFCISISCLFLLISGRFLQDSHLRGVDRSCHSVQERNRIFSEKRQNPRLNK